MDFDYENRLTAVKQGSTLIGEFVYDADGNRTVGTVNPSAGSGQALTTVYLDGLYEWQPGGANTRYYAGPDGVIALRRTGYATSNGVFSLLRDHPSISSGQV
ncbi:MAG: hypothetical protein KDD92_07940 [Caldilineaceae bacterium]|nr:hypothetical protein [Caldilineaceae bacterium]